ncbi:MAG: hypothetical protein HC873_17925 [Leptolyngbyaceae cyanobacterium SL_1_1]|nr:hypothetical protein [Leptolyngbyaceae cyanobacterium SL_1_1]
MLNSFAAALVVSTASALIWTAIARQTSSTKPFDYSQLHRPVAYDIREIEPV